MKRADESNPRAPRATRLSESSLSSDFALPPRRGPPLASSG